MLFRRVHLKTQKRKASLEPCVWLSSHKLSSSFKLNMLIIDYSLEKLLSSHTIALISHLDLLLWVRSTRFSLLYFACCMHFFRNGAVNRKSMTALEHTRHFTITLQSGSGSILVSTNMGLIQKSCYFKWLVHEAQNNSKLYLIHIQSTFPH